MSERVTERLKRAALAHPVALIAAATLALATVSVLYMNSRKGTTGSDRGRGDTGGVPRTEGTSSNALADETMEALQDVRRLRSISRIFSVGRARKYPMTISLKNVILWNPSPDPQTPNFAFLEGTLSFLKALAEAYELYLIMVVGSSQEAEHVSRVLEQSELYDSPPPTLDRRRLLFCQTEQGKPHIVRHIEPFVHVDTNREVAENLARFVKHVVLVHKGGVNGNTDTATTSKPLPANVETCTSILTSSLGREVLQSS